MYTLHQLNESKKRRAPESLVEGSTYDHSRTGLPSPPGTHEGRFDPSVIHGDTYPWGFDAEDIKQFPALKKRNFWCVQRHQARGLSPLSSCVMVGRRADGGLAHHYDLRMQLDGSTVSWAIPKGLLGMPLSCAC